MLKNYETATKEYEETLFNPFEHQIKTDEELEQEADYREYLIAGDL